MERRWAFCPLAAKIPIEDEKRLSLCRPAAYQKTRRTPASEECARVRLCTGPEFACVEVTGIREEVDYSIYCPAGGRLNPGTALSRREQQLCIHKWISSEGLSAFFSSNGKKKKKRPWFFWKKSLRIIHPFRYENLNSLFTFESILNENLIFLFVHFTCNITAVAKYCGQKIK